MSAKPDLPRFNRRGFVAGAAAGLLLPALPRMAGAQANDVAIEAKPASAQLVPSEYGRTDVWAYDGAVPGTLLRLRQGERLRRVLVNRLDQPTTIHWHGIRLENAMDGAAGLTQEAVAPGGRFIYDFTAKDAGTYWYHPHRNSLEQVSRGLSGALIVEEAETPDVDDDLILLIQDWRLDSDAQIVSDFANMHDMAHAGRIGNHLTVNGEQAYARPAKTGQRLRLRIINTASDRILRLGAQGLAGHVMALDGMPLGQPEPFGDIMLAPAQRADIFADVTAGAGETAHLTSIERDGTFSLAAFPVESAASSTVRPAPKALPSNPVAAPRLDDARKLDLVMEGGAMGRMATARMVDGETRSMRELIGHGMAWALNGTAGMTDQPLARLARGEDVRIRLVNQTAWPHAMHLHGHHLQEVTGETLGPLRDTILMMPQEEREIAFVADNPGKWMFHCHMLSHQAAGMMSWIDISG